MLEKFTSYLLGLIFDKYIQKIHDDLNMLTVRVKTLEERSYFSSQEVYDQRMAGLSRCPICGTEQCNETHIVC